MVSTQLTLVTGGLGFIGSHVCETLNKRGQDFVVLDFNRSSPNISLIESLPHCKGILYDDITEDPEILRASLGQFKFTSMVHLAAAISVVESLQCPEKYHRTNEEASRTLFELAREQGVQYIAAASSAAVYGDPAYLPLDEEAPKTPLSPYAWTKLNMESIAKSVPGPQYTFFRFFNVYGSRQEPSNPYTGVISIFLDRCYRFSRGDKVPITVFGDGNQTRDFVHVSDVARAVCDAMEQRPWSHEVFNVATGTSVTLLELIDVIKSLSGAYGIELKFEPLREGEIVHSAAVVQKIAERHGWKSEIELSQGLQEVWSWFESTK